LFKIYVNILYSMFNKLIALGLILQLLAFYLIRSVCCGGVTGWFCYFCCKCYEPLFEKYFVVLKFWNFNVSFWKILLKWLNFGAFFQKSITTFVNFLLFFLKVPKGSGTSKVFIKKVYQSSGTLPRLIKSSPRSFGTSICFTKKRYKVYEFRCFLSKSCLKVLQLHLLLIFILFDLGVSNLF